nr:hypothetical protein [Tanacetum cinerariifolium]
VDNCQHSKESLCQQKSSLRNLNKNVDTSPRYKNDNPTGKFRNHRIVTIARAKETVGSQGTVRFGNDQFALILGYGNLVQGNIKIGRVYYIKGLKQYLFSVGQFCDADFEIAFRKSTCFVRVSPTQAWLWDQRLAHLNFDYINMLSKKDVVIGLPKLKYVKDQLCYSCEVSKAKKSSFKTKVVQSLKEWLNLLYMDLCGPMRVERINRKKYILASDYEDSYPAPQQQIVSPSADATAPSQQELDLLFSPLYDEYFTAGTLSVNKSSSPTKNSKQQDTPPTMNV